MILTILFAVAVTTAASQHHVQLDRRQLPRPQHIQSHKDQGHAQQFLFFNRQHGRIVPPNHSVPSFIPIPLDPDRFKNLQTHSNHPHRLQRGHNPSGHQKLGTAYNASEPTKVVQNIPPLSTLLPPFPLPDHLRLPIKGPVPMQKVAAPLDVAVNKPIKIKAVKKPKAATNTFPLFYHYYYPYYGYWQVYPWIYPMEPYFNGETGASLGNSRNENEIAIHEESASMDQEVEEVKTAQENEPKNDSNKNESNQKKTTEPKNDPDQKSGNQEHKGESDRDVDKNGENRKHDGESEEDLDKDDEGYSYTNGPKEEELGQYNKAQKRITERKEDRNENEHDQKKNVNQESGKRNSNYWQEKKKSSKRHNEWKRNWSGTGIKIIETHSPRYNIKTQVSAPIYIAPEHGPVIRRRPERHHFPPLFQ